MRHNIIKHILTILCFLCFAAISDVNANEADVIEAKAHKTGNTYRFSVTVKHADTGWDHYADKWDVVDPDGNVLATRTLHHPHVNEQPFTRHLSGVKIPENITTVIIKAHDSEHGYGGKVMQISLP